jgi:CheY-like chemotaxis protein
MNPPSPRIPITILIVEDDEVDLMTVKRGLALRKIANEVVTAKDGLEALQLLRGDAGRPPLSKPIIILLDLNMPRMNGFEFLEALRKDQELHSTIVFVLTTSKSDEDRARAYAANIAGYIVKTDAGRTFSNAMEMLDLYWQVVVLP